MLGSKIILLCLLVLLLGSCQSSTQDTSIRKANEQVADPIKSEASSAAGDTTPIPSEAIESDWLLSPGKGAGQTQLGQTSESVKNRLGPADVGDAAMMHAVQVWYANHQTKSGHSLAIFTARDPGNDPAARITQLRVNSPRFQTKQGVGVGSSLSDLCPAVVIHQEGKPFAGSYLNFP